MKPITEQRIKEAVIKAAHFEKPDFIPMSFHINSACWQYYPQEALLDCMEEHPLLFPDFIRPKETIVPGFGMNSRKNEPYMDDWGCLWETSMDGITGTVIRHPLQNWDAFESYVPPNPETSDGLGPIDWKAKEAAVAEQKKNGQLVVGGLRHGHTFLQLCDIRGYQNFLFDMLDEEPGLLRLIEMVEQFNLHIVNRYVAMGVDMMLYPDDMGMQKGPMLSPDCFRRYLKPSYRRLIKPAKDKDILIHMHSDGDITELADDLTDSGVGILNLQDLVNGVDWIAERYAGKVCIELDIDRQSITPYGTPEQIDGLIAEEVERIGRKEGGLMMIYGLYPGVPLANVKALMDAMEKYMFFF